jgi:hypothetical protein
MNSPTSCFGQADPPGTRDASIGRDRSTLPDSPRGPGRGGGVGRALVSGCVEIGVGVLDLALVVA